MATITMRVSMEVETDEAGGCDIFAAMDHVRRVLDMARQLGSAEAEIRVGGKVVSKIGKAGPALADGGDQGGGDFVVGEGEQSDTLFGAQHEG